LEKTPFNVRFPIRICFSKKAVNIATHKTIATIPTIPERTVSHDAKLKIEIAWKTFQKLSLGLPLKSVSKTLFTAS
jgi:hypothetical protein